MFTIAKKSTMNGERDINTKIEYTIYRRKNNIQFMNDDNMAITIESYLIFVDGIKPRPNFYFLLLAVCSLVTSSHGRRIVVK